MPAFIDVLDRPDVRIVHSTRLDGDFRPDSPDIAGARTGLSPHPWSQLAEDHGVEIREVGEPGEHDGYSGDVLISRVRGATLGMWVGDCAPVVLLGREWIAGVHAGWRGARDGVLEGATAAMIERGDPPTVAVVGAHIGPCCYEFGLDDLDRVEQSLGALVRDTDRFGRPSLDMGSVVRHRLRSTTPDIRLVEVGLCTACRADLFFSHRARRETGRHVLAVWREVA